MRAPVLTELRKYGHPIYLKGLLRMEINVKTRRK
ncbi:uncharacterized protein G2W53_008855 [Senna tora]|uniref:Uncharacterized protein n=1 Tax=Senna tora TaxID=362788 RepID=A0A835C6X8_9FABA|nr:uncharacterized protein G2W53_008855 [Senna tora]